MIKQVSIMALLLVCAACAATAAAQTADELMAKAHDGRAEWKNFPGFTADIEAATDQRSTKGKLHVSADGKVSLELESPEGFEWAERSLRSIVGHRLTDEPAIRNLEFADNDVHHPLGRLLKPSAADDPTRWRVQGDVMTEVHRRMEKTRFIISISEVTRNAEGKHLPRTFTVTTWDNATNQIVSARQVYNEWTRVGAIDLPRKLLAANAKSDGSRTVEQVVLSNHQLLPSGDLVKTRELAPLPTPRTSFGAALLDGRLYVYGGHMGAPHDYSAEQQGNELHVLGLEEKGEWKRLGSGPRRTGTALVAHGGKLYRIGGFEARNDRGEKWELHSMADAAVYDPAQNAWRDLPALPLGRSSHDAAVLGNKIYVVGGWELSGEGDGKWHNALLSLDLAAKEPKWEKVAETPFFRRALAAAAFDGKLYVIGGMDDNGTMTTEVDIYDPAQNSWSKGPALPGQARDGFGVSAFGTSQGLLASTASGGVYQLKKDASQWEQVAQLTYPRYFHRLLATDAGEVYIVGGTKPRGPKVAEVETLSIARPQ